MTQLLREAVGFTTSLASFSLSCPGACFPLVRGCWASGWPVDGRGRGVVLAEKTLMDGGDTSIEVHTPGTAC